MSISDAEFRVWLNAETTVKTVLVEAVYLERVPPGSEEPGVLGVEYLATHPFVSAPTDDPANTAYLSRIKSIPAFAQSMSDLMIGRTTANLGEIVIVAGDEYTDGWIFDRDWVGRSLRLYVGDVAWPKADFRAVWTGVIADLGVKSTSEIVFVARDMQHLLNQPILTPTFEAGPSLGLPVPLVYGPANNVPAILIDAATHTYQINDGPVSAISQVRVAGIVTAPASTDLFAGTFTMTSATPAGLVTADVTGASIGSSAMDNASDLIRYLVTTRGYLADTDLDVDSFNALKALCPQKLAYFVPPAETMVYEAVDEIVNTVGAFYAVNREGKLYVKRFDFDGTPALSITESDIVGRSLQLTRILQPVKEIKIGAKKNNARTVNLVGGFGWATETVINSAPMHHHALGTADNPESGAYAKHRKLPNPEPPEGSEGPDDGTLPSLFANAADAAAEAARRMTLWGVPRYVFSVKCFVAPLTLNLGDTVTLQHPRYGLADGRNGVVVKMVERLSQKQVELSVIV